MSNDTHRTSNEPAPEPRERPGSRGSGSAAPQDPSPGTRRGRRERNRDRPRLSSTQRPFLERHRTLVLGFVAVVAIVLVGGFVLVQTTSKAYACSTLTAPAAAAVPASGSSPAPLGQVQPDMGRSHVADGTFVRYAECPPASGNHYSSTLGPIPATYYSPNDSTVPQGWIHNMEHGAMVIVYSCDRGSCDDATQQQLKDLAAAFPNSPVCGVPRGNVGPIITRFEDMNAPFAAMVWGRVLFQDKLDTAQMLEFFRIEGELHNPEPQCQRPAATSAPTAAPSATPSGAPAPSPTVAPSPS